MYRVLWQKQRDRADNPTCSIWNGNCDFCVLSLSIRGEGGRWAWDRESLAAQHTPAVLEDYYRCMANFDAGEGILLRLYGISPVNLSPYLERWLGQ